METDPQHVRRVVLPKSINSDVFIVGQALGSSTQRLSGIPYCFPDGQLSRTGAKLDRFLNRFGYTINPRSSFRRAYSSDIVQRYPGPARGGDRKPTRAEVSNCSGWLQQEMRLVRPKVVILVGSLAGREFLRQYAATPLVDRASRFWGQPQLCLVERFRLIAFPVPHFAYRYGALPSDQIYRSVARKIRNLLETAPQSTAATSAKSTRLLR